MSTERRPIPGYEKYTIDTNGVLVDTSVNQVIEPSIYTGYYTYTLTIDGKRRMLGQHRALMLAFSPVSNSDELHVNHINGNKHDNNLSNLEWCTPQENRYHAGYNQLTPKCIPVTVMNVINNELLEFPTIESAATHMNITKDKALWMFKHPNSVVHIGGWRMKKYHDNWLPVDNPDIALHKDKTNQPVVGYNWIYEVEAIFSSQHECALEIGVSDALISLELNENRQRMLPGLWMVKRPAVPWVAVTDPWLKYEQDSNERPVICTYPDGTWRIYENIAQCSADIGVGVTTIHYRLSNNKTEPGRNGYAFQYYSDSVR